MKTEMSNGLALTTSIVISCIILVISIVLLYLSGGREKEPAVYKYVSSSCVTDTVTVEPDTFYFHSISAGETLGYHYDIPFSDTIWISKSKFVVKMIKYDTVDIKIWEKHLHTNERLK